MAYMFFGYMKAFIHREKGVTLLEAAVALALVGIIVATFMNGLAVSSKTVILSDERSTAESLARIQMEWVKSTEYSVNATSYTPAPIPSGGSYENYSAEIAAESIHTPDDGLQKVSVTIMRSGDPIITLEGYKVNR